MDLKFYQMVEFLNTRLANIERNIERLDEKINYSLTLQKNHLIRIKNGDYISDRMILESMPYNDLTPQKAFEIYNDTELDFIVVDVSKEGTVHNQLKGSIHIPLEELKMRHAEIPNRTTPVLIISEKGLRSIQACELLVQRGFYNVNNISGGHIYWPKDQEFYDKGRKMHAA